MNDAQILDIIQKALVKVAPDRAGEWTSVDLGKSIEELGLDSIVTMEMVTEIEDVTGVTFPDEDLPKVNTLGDLATLVKKNL
jgi:acyl carrier protein